VTPELDTDPPAASLDRAEAIVAEVEQRTAEVLSVLLVRAVEEAQDIWAEAQAVHRQQHSE
jgi:hypothetical protein